MKYVIKVVYSCPEGFVTKTQYHLASDEEEMTSILDYFRDEHYEGATCIGPIESLPMRLSDKIKNRKIEEEK